MFRAFRKYVEKAESEAAELKRLAEVKARELELEKVRILVDFCIKAQEIKDPEYQEIAMSLAHALQGQSKKSKVGRKPSWPL